MASTHCSRLCQKQLASDMPIQMEHLNPLIHHDELTFECVVQPNEAELGKIQSLVDRLIAAA